ncbi:hypothetical protein METBIDRAFT_9959 [Metschnikowia bicuspidata var. bicuspidata NRRL YB-4993]|uniref:Uncharacterized protein n=1 Tax=Metschnikowia bicuspidata var. bicuspidata NRRL YB-4993 TaxID=869754 RepID=A0A1A0HI95_9ASCO|nr:hypothetical protein METBIDRAFT_9959 [Metschnikowia bicuspidata var. bicuspidata NRRL YB-4993]OBA23721.1 hypothetical protein METBIDRAFT_9959 [Metschnikowia bicuspidata var. bicuspidata NRRL YB-4993]
MFRNFALPWFKKSSLPLPLADVPKSFTLSGGNDSHTYKVSMEDTSRGLIEEQETDLPGGPAKTARPSGIVGRAGRPGPAAADLPEMDDDSIHEKFKTNNYFLKNKVYKQSDRNPKRKVL